MSQVREDTRIIINLDNTFNPYKDKTLTETQPDTPVLGHKEAFNDVVKHGDIIVGHQRNRTLSDYPKRTRPWVRIYSIVTLVLLVGGILWDLMHW